MTFLQSALTNRIPLSSSEILDISLQISRDFAPRFAGRQPAGKSGLFSTHELLSISQEIERDFGLSSAKKTQTLVLLPIAPNHLHTYWQLEENKTGILQKSLQDKGLTLRVFSHSPDLAAGQSGSTWFDIPLNAGQGSHALLLTSIDDNVPKVSEVRGTESAKTAVNNTLMPKVYSAIIGFKKENQAFSTIISSNYTYLPDAVPEFAKTALPSEFSQFLSTKINISSATCRPDAYQESRTDDE